MTHLDLQTFNFFFLFLSHSRHWLVALTSISFVCLFDYFANMIYLLWFAIIWLLCALLSFCCSISKLTKQTNHSFKFHFKIPFLPPSLLRLLLYLGYSSASFCDCNSPFPPFPGSLTSLLHFFSATRHRILFTASLLLYVRFPFDRCRCCFGLLMDDLCLCWRHHRLLFLLLCYWSLFNWLIFL